ncbi:nitroreductase family protein [Caldalkalibacillus salinus]|uniref:nitroreductase family protein n=1 Tax=Caldalkalibacillus salinus TaxID=2803787 RepID=UPI0019229AED|nr:nitroreductase family protein [Caldalkalibacillus salinus]
MLEMKGFIPLNFERKSGAEQWRSVSRFTEKMSRRRSVRAFSDEDILEETLEKVIQAAGTSPSGANQQPWQFVLIKDPSVKKAIREASDRETTTQNGEGSPRHKSLDYLEEAPYLIALYRENYGLKQDESGKEQKVKHYYALESAAICAGFLLTAIEHAGLDCVVHQPVQAAQDILNRPKNEAMIALFAVGKAKSDYQAPTLARKALSEVILGDINMPEGTTQAPEFQSQPHWTPQEQLQQATDYYETIRRRRNIRDFSTEDVDIKLVEKALEVAATTPSAGNVQPYRFAVVSQPSLKRQIREQAEIEEKKLYEERMSDEWREALSPLGTNWQKPHLTDAPHLIIAFKVEEDRAQQAYDDGTKVDKRGPEAMTAAGMAVGVLLSALHHAGVCTLTHTPSPMAFLRDLLGRPKNEMPIVVLPVGYPTEDCHVPGISKKPLTDILSKI